MVVVRLKRFVTQLSGVHSYTIRDAVHHHHTSILIVLNAQNYKITHHIIKFRPQKVNLRRNHFIKNNLHKIPISHLFYLRS